jgi:hemolysin activation/secretion protein
MARVIPRDGWLVGFFWLYLLSASAVFADSAVPEPARPDTPASEPQPAAAAAPTFDIWEFQVEGNTLLDSRRVERAVYPLLGPARSIADVETARKALEEQYHQAGFQLVLVDIPEQKVQDGVVRLTVTETRVDRVYISGSRYYSLGQIRAGMRAIASGQTPHIPSMQEELTVLSQQTPDRVVTPIMRAGRTPGTVEFELKVKDQLPLHGSLEVNNRNTEDTSRLRTAASLRYDNLWQRYHSASLQYQVAPEEPDEVTVWAGTYVMPIGGSNRLALYAVDSQSDVATVGALNVVGNGSIYGARAIFPLPASGSYFHSTTLGVDYKQFKENVLQGSDTAETPIDYAPFLVRYDGVLRQETWQLNFDTALNWAFRHLVTSRQQFDEKRFGAQSNYLYLTGNVNYLQRLPADFRLATRLGAQLSAEPLISNEQYSAGGMESVRGYFESQVLGDKGVTGSLELQSPYLGRDGWKWLSDLRALVFVDGALLRVVDALPGQEDSFDLLGTGFGLQMSAFKSLTWNFDYAWALQSAGSVSAGDQRADFQLLYEF